MRLVIVIGVIFNWKNLAKKFGFNLESRELESLIKSCGTVAIKSIILTVLKYRWFSGIRTFTFCIDIIIQIDVPIGKMMWDNVLFNILFFVFDELLYDWFSLPYSKSGL